MTLPANLSSGDTITEAWVDSVSTSIADLQAVTDPTFQAALSSRYVLQANTQSAETTLVTPFTVQPHTAGSAPFQIMFNSFPNGAGGTGTVNHGMWFGFNASRHAQGGGDVNGKPAVYMGFEDDFYDTVDGSAGAEWYTGYVSPDGTSVPIAGLRPFFWRILNGMTNDPAKRVNISLDTGAGGGHFGVYAGVGSAALFELNTTVTIVRTQFTVASNAVTITPASGAGSLTINGTASGLALWVGGATAAGFVATSVNQFYFYDKAGTPTLVMNYGATVAASLTDLRTSLQVGGTATVLGGTVNISGSLPNVCLQVANVAAGYLVATSVNQMYLADKAATPTLVMNYGATVAASLADLRTSLKVGGNVGFYNTAPVAKPTGVAVTAAGIHAALVTLGLIAA